MQFTPLVTAPLSLTALLRAVMTPVAAWAVKVAIGALLTSLTQPWGREPAPCTVRMVCRRHAYSAFPRSYLVLETTSFIRLSI